MSKLITVPTAWAVYKVPDEVMAIFGAGAISLPPQMVLESLVMNGLAKRVAVTSPFEFVRSDSDEDQVWSSSEDGPKELIEDEDAEEDEQEGESGLWYNPQEK